MEIISKKDAEAAGLKKYFTGKACKHGHITYRYVQSSTCAACVGVAVAVTKSPDAGAIRAEAQAVGEVRLKALKQLTEENIRAATVDLPQLKELVGVTVTARFPMLTEDDAYPNKAPTDRTAGTALFRFRVHPDDLELIRGSAISWMRARSVDVQAARQRAAEQAVRMANEMADPVPEFRP